MRVYISGGITGISDYLKTFKEAETVLSLLGYDVINPATCNLALAERLSYDEIMEICYLEVKMCDAVVLLPGWERSRGANLEKNYAEESGIDVYEYEDFVFGIHESVS